MTETLMARRARLMGPNVPTFHDEPLHLVRGQGVWLWDAAGRRYLDCYNNVPHVGHGHPRVVAEIARQSAELNIHTRYVHGLILDYIERLTAGMDGGLGQMILTCTGSEANDVALRIAQAATGRTGVIATDNTYHGNTTATAALSTRRPPIGGYPPHVRLVPAPDSLGGADPAAEGAAFADSVRRAAAELEAAGHGLSALILCPVLANEGLPALPPGTLAPAAEAARAAGGLVICDEVQPGFGRVGPAFWGHRAAGLVPDVVTLGKAMANGYPAAGVAARPELLAAFRTAFGYFNTYGGNPVACAAAMAVLDILDEERLPENAAATGALLAEGLRGIAHPAIAEVRAAGFLLGVVLTDGAGAPDGVLAARVVEGMRRRGVLIGRIGREMHILKLRPPMPFGPDEARLTVAALAGALEEAGDA